MHIATIVFSHLDNLCHVTTRVYQWVLVHIPVHIKKIKNYHLLCVCGGGGEGGTSIMIVHTAHTHPRTHGDNN